MVFYIYLFEVGWFYDSGTPHSVKESSLESK